MKSQSLQQIIPVRLEELLHKLERVPSVADLVLLLEWDLCKGTLEAIWLEDGIPAKVVIATRRNNRTIALTDKDLWLMALALAESESTLRIGRAVVKALKHVIEAFAAQISQEILDVGSGESFHRVEAEGHIFDDDSRVAVFSCFFGFASSDSFRRAL